MKISRNLILVSVLVLGASKASAFAFGDRSGLQIIAVGGTKGYVNPRLNEVARIIVVPDRTGTLTLKIYTSAGNLVVTKTRDAIMDIQNEFVWDARDSNGQTVASGIYRAVVTGSGLNNSARIAVVRN